MILGLAIGFMVPILFFGAFYTGYRCGKSKTKIVPKKEFTESEKKQLKAMEELKEMMYYDVNKAYGR